MKKFTVLVLVLISIIIVYVFPVFSQAASMPENDAEAALMMDVETGQIVYEKNMTQRLYPASITKIMTAILAIENGNLSDIVTAHISAVSPDVVDRQTTHISLVDGEKLSLESLLYATMLVSANDAANVIAEHIGSSLSNFAKMMNEKAKELGCDGTNFINASGLPDDNHYTTAKDMGLITEYALKNKTFRKFFSTVTYEIPATNKNTARTVASVHSMLKQGTYYYENVTGGKTGYTKAAGYTSVTTAKKGDKEFICVLLKCPNPNDRFKFSIDMFDYAFADFDYVTLKKDAYSGKTVDIIDGDYKVGKAIISLENDIRILLNKNLTEDDIIFFDSVPATYSKTVDEPYLTLKLKNNDVMYNTLSSNKLLASVTTLAVPTLIVNEGQKNNSGVLNIVLTVLMIMGIIVGVFALLFIILIIYAAIERKKRKEKRRQMRIRRQKAKKENEELNAGIDF